MRIYELDIQGLSRLHTVKSTRKKKRHVRQQSYRAEQWPIEVRREYHYIQLSADLIKPIQFKCVYPISMIANDPKPPL